MCEQPMPDYSYEEEGLNALLVAGVRQEGRNGKYDGRMWLTTADPYDYKLADFMNYSIVSFHVKVSEALLAKLKEEFLQVTIDEKLVPTHDTSFDSEIAAVVKDNMKEVLEMVEDDFHEFFA